MSTAQQAATVVALRPARLQGLCRPPLGALVYGILPGSPAASALQVGDVISKINGVEVPYVPESECEARGTGSRTTG